MELETLRLVAFALWAESNEGVTGKSPAEITGRITFFNLAKDLEDLRFHLGDELVFKLDNYLTVWEAAEEPEAPAPDKERAEAEAALEEIAERGGEITDADAEKILGIPITPAEETERVITDPALIITEAVGPPKGDKPQPKKQRGKRG